MVNYTEATRWVKVTLKELRFQIGIHTHTYKIVTNNSIYVSVRKKE